MVDILFAELNIPFVYVAAYVLIITLGALFSRTEFLLAVTYIFVFYLGYFKNRTLIQGLLEGSPFFVILYFVSGAFILVLALLTFLKGTK